MYNLYNKIYKAINEGIQKALLIVPEQNDVSINYSYHKIDNYADSLLIKFIDLGLPSGTLWCDHNLGTTCKSTAKSWYGSYYAWGETKMKKEYNWKKYSSELYAGKEKLIKYNTKPEFGIKVDNQLNLLPEDDAVQCKYQKKVNSKMAKRVKMPTIEQINELLQYTISEWVTDYNDIDGLNGRILTSKINNNFIFIPAAGYYSGLELYKDGEYCFLWSNSLKQKEPIKAYNAYFYKDKINNDENERYFGFSVRGICL